jgi:hypothetical protein
MTHLLPSRRRFLKKSLSGMIVLTAAGLLPRRVSAFEPGPDLRFFSRHEYRLVNALAQRIVGLRRDPAEHPSIDVARRADIFLTNEDPEFQRQVHLLLALFGSPLLALLFNVQYASFLEMEGEQQDEYLEGWMTSSLAFRRTSFVALKRLCLSMYYADSHSWGEIHYEGMFLPEERP